MQVMARLLWESVGDFALRTKRKPPLTHRLFVSRTVVAPCADWKFEAGTSLAIACVAQSIKSSPDLVRGAPHRLLGGRTLKGKEEVNRATER